MRPTTLKQGDVHNSSNLVQIQGFDDERELSISTSTISFDGDYFPRNVIDDLDEIYTHRFHKRCINLTYLTLLSMTCGVIFWMIYWLTIDEHCQTLLPSHIKFSNCKFAFIFEMLTFVSISFSPFLFILMIIFWIIFSCTNPIDRIRNDFIGFRLEGDQWKNQLNYYFKKKKTCFQCCSYQKRKKLIDRNFGYIILSTHGIIFDELFLLSSDKHILINGILIDNGRILKLIFKNCFKNEILIYLPDQIINPEVFQEVAKILKINLSPSSFIF